jgi:hypothetical protein
LLLILVQELCKGFDLFLSLMSLDPRRRRRRRRRRGRTTTSATTRVLDKNTFFCFVEVAVQ